MEMLRCHWKGLRYWSGWRQLWGWLKRYFVELLVLLPIVGVLSVIPALVYWEEIWSWAHGNGASKGATLRNLALAYGAFLAAFIGLPLAIWRSFVANRQAKTANRQAETSERGVRNERYQKGAEMLGSDTLATRLGGIYALERLAGERPEDYHVQIMDQLCAFVRHPTKTEAESEAGDAVDREPRCPPDIEAAAKTVGKYRRRLSDEGRLKDIEGDRRLDLVGVQLTRADLWGVHLVRANLEGAHLAGAHLVEAHLAGAHLVEAHLAGAHLEGAHLAGAHLAGAHLAGAHLEGAHLEGAHLAGAHLEGAHLTGAIGLTQEMLNGARPSPPPKSLPEGLSWPFEGGEDGRWRLRPQP